MFDFMSSDKGITGFTLHSPHPIYSLANLSLNDMLVLCLIWSVKIWITVKSKADSHSQWRRQADFTLCSSDRDDYL